MSACHTFGLTLTQQDIYFDQIKHPDNPHYNVGGCIKMAELDIKKFIFAHQKVVSSNQAFGIRIVVGDGGVSQYISEHRTLALDLIDFSGHQDPEAAANQWLRERFESVIDFRGGELFQAALLKLADNKHWYMGLCHHLAMDGWGFANWARQIGKYYADPEADREQATPWQEIADKDALYLKSKKYQKDKQYWYHIPELTAGKLLPPYYRSRFKSQSKIASRRKRLILDTGLMKCLNRFAKQEQTGPAQIFLGLIAGYLACTYHRNHLVLGLPAHNRKNFSEKQMPGVFTSVSPIALSIAGEHSFSQILAQIAQRQKSNFRHQRFPIGHIINNINQGNEELYDVSFNYLKLDSHFQIEEKPCEFVYLSHNHELTPLNITIWEFGEGADCELQIDYSSQYFSNEEADLLARRLEFLLRQLLNHPDVPLKRLERIPALESQAMLKNLTPPPSREQAFVSLAQGFSAQAKQSPNAIALTCTQSHGLDSQTENSLTYAQLDLLSDSLALRLIDRGAAEEDLIAVCVDRSPQMLISILAVLKTGAAYVPIDPSYPAGRIQHILQDCQAEILLTQDKLVSQLPLDKMPHLSLLLCEQEDTAPLKNKFVLSELAANSAAYVIYTSGSTGTPKGVVVGHQAIARHIQAAIDYFGFTGKDKVYQFASFSFDTFLEQTFAALCCGARLYLRGNRVPDSQAFLDYINHHEVTITDLAPAYLAQLLTPEHKQGWRSSSLTRLVVGGEALSTELVSRWFDIVRAEQIKLFNAYGPTEAVITALCHEITADDLEQVAIGCAYPGKQLFILDKDQRLTPTGVCGELYIGGKGLALGYLNAPALTRERFVTAPALNVAGQRLYKTGDLVRMLPNGQLTFLGREDEQVKIRGFRIELAEISHQLDTLSQVRESLVIPQKWHGSTRLIAYYIAELGQEDGSFSSLLRTQLQQSLPDYMLPDVFIRLSEWPLTTNGKIDRTALPEADFSRLEGEYLAPQNETETLLAEIWADLLDLEQDKIGRNSHFFHLGGHSLLAVRLISELRSRVNKALDIKQVFDHPLLYQLALVVQQQSAVVSPDSKVAIKARDKQDTLLPLSPAQSRLWFIDQYEGSSAQYHMPVALKITGAFDVAKAENAIAEIIRRHEILRTRYMVKEGQAYQEIQKPGSYQLQVTDLTSVSTLLRSEKIQQFIEANASKVFDLTKDLMLRTSWLKIAEDEQGILLLCLHHIAADGWSLGIFIREFIELYQSGSNKLLAPLPLQYADYALWQKQVLRALTPDYKAQTTNEQQLLGQWHYWQNQLADLPIVHNFPLDFPRPKQMAFQGGKFTGSIAAELAAQINQSSQLLGITPFMLVHAALSILLARYSGSSDIVIGTPVANRTRTELNPVIGCFVNTLILRTQLADDLALGEYLAHIKQVNLQAQDNQDIPFDHLVEKLKVQRSSEHAPLFQIMLSMDNSEQDQLALPGVKIEEMTALQVAAKFDLELMVEINGADIKFNWLYDRALFKPETPAQLHQHLHTLLAAITQQQDCRLSELSMLSGQEIHHLLVELNDNQCSYDADALLHQPFVQQASKVPDKLALVCANQKYSYGQLDLASNQLAHYLREHGVTDGTLVGISMQRNADMIIALLAILKAGAAYVPLDPSYPASRIQFIAGDLALEYLIGQGAVIEKLFAAKAGGDHKISHLLALDSPKLKQNLSHYSDAPVMAAAGKSSDELAYIIYTSGSTGTPKGVAVTHKNFAALLHWARSVFSPAELSKTLASTSLNFDLSVFEIFVPLSLGHQVVLVANALALLENQLDITLINTVPSAIEALLAQEALPPGTKLVNLAGEPLPARVVNQLLQGNESLRVCNLYGPSEDTTYSTWASFSQPVSTVPAIGRVIDNSQAYILSPRQELVPKGSVGELYLGGDGVTQGYYQRPELTGQKYISSPFALLANRPAGDRLYRTGDLVRYLDNGEMEFIGRADDQVKLHGFRIELGEIEYQLASSARVAKAVVMVRALDDIQEAGARHLLAYVVPEANSGAYQAEQLAQELNLYLTDRLPVYMVPKAIIVMEQFPLTANGKIDKKRLPSPDFSTAQGLYLAPETKTELVLTEIWQKLLPVTGAIGARDNFFDLGGHSLLIVKLVAEIRNIFAKHITMKQVFEAPVLADLAVIIDELPHESEANQIRARQVPGGVFPLSHAQQRLWFLEQMQPGSNQFNMSKSFIIEGKFSPLTAEQAIREIINRHSALRTVFIADETGAKQEIRQEWQWQLKQADLSALASPEREQTLKQLKAQENNRPFDLTNELLIRVCYFHLAGGTNPHGQLQINIHHIAADGWSVDLLVKEFIQLYQANLADSPAHLPQLSIDYVDFALWQHELPAQAREQKLSYWQELLLDAPACHALPLDYPRENHPDQPRKGEVVNRAMTSSWLTQAQALLKACDSTLFMLMQTALALHIGRLSYETDVILGAPVVGRSQPQTQELIGLFLNTQVYRTEFADNPDLKTLLQRSKAQHLASMAHSDAPFEAIVERINPARNLLHSPLFQVMINLNNNADTEFSLEGVNIFPAENEAIDNKYDITLYIKEPDSRDKPLALTWVYDCRLFSRETIARFADEFNHLLEQIIACPEKPVLEYSWLSAPKWQQISESSTNSGHSPSIAGYIEHLAATRPEDTALAYRQQTWNYQQLNKEVNQLAHLLMGQYQIDLNKRVTLAISRSPLRIKAILALLKIGACYVPLSEELPGARSELMASIAGADLVLSDRQFIQDNAWVSDLEPLQLDSQDSLRQLGAQQSADPAQMVIPDDAPAHIIFTSGSTGTPKGVAGTYGATKNRIRWMLDKIPFEANEAMAHITSMAFIRAVWELLVPLCGGAKLLLLDRDTVKDSHQLQRQLASKKITRLVTAPSLMKALSELDSEPALTLKHWFVSGEPLLTASAAKLLQRFPQVKLYNLYGSTEVMSDVVCHQLAPAGSESLYAPIGKAIDNTRVIVVDRFMQPVPEGMTGELAVLGSSLANGYINADQKSAANFVKTPAGRAYRTGDLGRVNPEGELECLGRCDDQIKIRGYRVEPGEVARQLLKQDAVASAVVLVRRLANNQDALAAYVVLHSPADCDLLCRKTEQELYAALRVCLPQYMLPAAICIVPEIPLRPNGKVNKQALPDIVQVVRNSADISHAETELEKELAVIWGELLGLAPDEIGIDGHFFDLGGHSLLVTQLLQRIKARHGLLLNYREFFEKSTIRHLAKTMEKALLVKQVTSKNSQKKSRIVI
ncbi:non-ribosomal peptide synthetase [Thalassomonas sp. RHCl1]|uniref:non-ribosomal peptide synthetase n=1 Tax=Thalassomonas sp. RHCl1 TaxID=2995320 RepID=UPI00248A96BD|nr:non-ribosomal peptide synthetase [Thalassomonas sp. RHCl1]